MKTYALATLGCKVNQYESDQIKSQLARLTKVAFGDDADLYVINACSVTGEAEAKARQLINRARRAAPGAFLVLTGCWPAAKADAFTALGVDLLLDNAAKANLAERLPRNRFGPGSQATASPATPADGVYGRALRTRTFIKVQDGCDQFCSYCAVPLYRASPSSRPVEEVVADIDARVEAGAPEVVLAGINLGKYGDDRPTGPDLTGLVQKILEATDVPRLRLSSIEPGQVTDGLVDLMAAEPRLASHLHIPLQSGSDRILAAMDRDYSSGEYQRLVDKIRRRLPDIGLTTDIIVGFPAETEDDFKTTLGALRAAAFSRVHVFKYSARPGTKAATLSGQIGPAIKSERAAAARALADRLAADFAAGSVGRPVSVVIEGWRHGRRTGLTSHYLRVQFEQAIDNRAGLVNAVGIKNEADILIVRELDG